MKETKGLSKSETHSDLFSLEEAMSGLAFDEKEQGASDVKRPIADGASAVTAEELSAGNSSGSPGKSQYALLDERRAKSLQEQEQALKGLAANGFLAPNHSSQPLIVSDVGNGFKRRNFSSK
jgi:hypothetical protein